MLHQKVLCIKYLEVAELFLDWDVQRRLLACYAVDCISKIKFKGAASPSAANNAVKTADTQCCQSMLF